MKNLLAVLIIGSLFSFTLLPDLHFAEDNVTAKFTYTSQRCNYDVYKATGGGTIRCNDWDFVGTVSPSRKVSVTLYPGDNVLVRVVHDNADVCDGSEQKRQDNLSLRSNATRSSSTSWELHDWDCER